MNNNEEIKRVLDMVESGRISAAEGAALLESAQTFTTSETTTCPYCAESIASDGGICPECGSNLAIPFTAPPSAGSGFQALSGLGKFLVVYTLLVSGYILLHLFFKFDSNSAFTALLAALGLAAGIMILRDHPSGWKLGMLWSALQIVPVIIHYQPINEQFFHLGIKNHVNGQGLGFNLVGLILLILFIKAKPARP
jgi:predicted amidophosphoribosyltransferase